jgi:Ca2+/H+ antiporter
MGALRYWEQEYNLEGARSFLVVIASLAVFALIIPDFAKTEPDPSLSPFQAGAVRGHHHSVLWHFPRHSDHAAPRFLRRAGQR